MKNLVMIFRSSLQAELADQLRELPQIESFFFAQVEGHFTQTEDDELLSARDKVVGYTSRVRADILVNDADVVEVLSAIRDRANGVSGHGIYWLIEVHKSGEL